MKTFLFVIFGTLSLFGLTGICLLIVQALLEVAMHISTIRRNRQQVREEMSNSTDVYH